MEVLKIGDIEKLYRSFLTTTEAARAMVISANTFRRHIADIDFLIVRFGRKIHIPKEPFPDFLRRGKCEKGKEVRTMEFEKYGVITICHGQKREWADRSEARKFFLDEMMISEGSERERYYGVYLKIVHGYYVCSDSEE